MKKLLLTLAVLLSLGLGRSVRALPVNTYYTEFKGTENPLSEGGLWLGGKTTGGSWNDGRSTPGLFFGNQDGLQGNGVYTDSIHMLRGSFGPTQSLTSQVKATNQQTGNNYQEVEHLLRWTMDRGKVYGYEINYRNQSSGIHYVGIVKWLGPFGGDGVQFTQLGSNCTTFTGLSDGDVVNSTISGTTTTTITAFINGVQVCQQTDSSSPWLAGNPGIGHWLHWDTISLGSASDYGWLWLLIVCS